MAKAMDKEHRIRWNEAEKSRLIEEGRKVVAQTPMKPLEALAQAQLALPKARRRQVATAAKVRWFVKGIGLKNGGARAARGLPARAPVALATGLATPSLRDLKGSLVAFFADVFADALDEVRARSRAASKPSTRTSKAPARKDAGASARR